MQLASSAGQKAYAPVGRKRLIVHVTMHAYRPIFMSVDVFICVNVDRDYICHVCVSVQTVRMNLLGLRRIKASW